MTQQNEMDKRLLTPEEIQMAIREAGFAYVSDYQIHTSFSIAKAQLLKADKAKLDRPELIEAIKGIFCRQCDGVSHAETCDLDKAECPVLQTAPAQILALFDVEYDRGFADGVSKTTDACNSTFDSLLVEAKREESKKWIEWITKNCRIIGSDAMLEWQLLLVDNEMVKEWQESLKEGE